VSARVIGKPHGNRAERRATEHHLRRRVRRTYRGLVRAEEAADLMAGTPFAAVAKLNLERRAQARQAASADLDKFQSFTKEARA